MITESIGTGSINGQVTHCAMFELNSRNNLYTTIDSNCIGENCFGGYIEKSDLNGIPSGIFWINGYSNDIVNKPFISHFILITGGNDTKRMQLAINYDTSDLDIKKRLYLDGSWTDWSN